MKTADSVKRILIVEDEPDIIKVLKLRLNIEKFDVISALDGAEGYAAFWQQKPDLLILDLNLPKINGHEVCRRIREDMKDKTPIIMLTAEDGELKKIIGRLEGADKYMTKPFDMDELIAEVKRLINRSETE